MEYYNQMTCWNNPKWSGLEEEEIEARPLQVEVPETPKETMEFLSRSWSAAAEDISRALTNSQNHPVFINHPHGFVDRVMDFTHSGRMSEMIGKWFHHTHGSTKNKDKARAQNAHTHATLSVAGLAAAMAALSAAQVDTSSPSNMSRAMASAMELLASRCIEMAEQAGAHHDRVASMLISAVDVSTPGDLITLNAAAATALRAEAALSSRFPREQPKRNAAISPFTDVHFAETEDRSLPCAGDLLQHTRKGGVLRWKRVKIYMNKKSQVKIKLKSKHVGGAFSKKDKCLVYGLSDDISTSPSMNMEGQSTETYFGLQTVHGFLEFKCMNEIHKQQWVDGIRSLLNQAQCSGHSMELNNRR